MSQIELRYKLTLDAEGTPEEIRQLLRNMAEQITFASFYAGGGGMSEKSWFVYGIKSVKMKEEVE